MLVLQRKEDEEIYITDSNGIVIAAIAIVRVLGASVQVGVEAKRDIGIYRDELCFAKPIVGQAIELRGGKQNG